jgi:hypothetical protein
MTAELKIGDNVYNIKAPTLKEWMRFNRIDSFGGEEDNLNICVKLLSVLTGESEQSIRECPYQGILDVGNQVLNFIMGLSKKFHKSFTFQNIEYEFCDLNKISFGHYMDIDHFFSKKPSERKNELNIHLALLYLPKKDGGKYLSNTVMDRAEKFKDLSIEYYFGALFFFKVLKNQLRINSPNYLWKVMWIKMPKITAMITSLLTITGVGMLRLKLWLGKILPKSPK